MLRVKPSILIALALGLAVSAAAAADQRLPQDRLKELQSALQRGQQQEEEIRRRADEAAAEAERVRTQMVATARAVQEHEDSLSELENQLIDLATIEKSKSLALDLKRQQLNAVLTALQRLAFRPSEALVAQPTSPADTVRSAILLKDVVPRIESQVADLKTDIEGLAAIRTDIAQQKIRITQAAAKLDSEHQRLAGYYLKKQLVQQQTESERQAAEQRLQAMAAEAADLRDLLARLEEEKRRREEEEKARAAAEKAAREAEIAAAKAAREAEVAAAKAAHDAELAAAKAAKEKRERERAEALAAKAAEKAAQDLARQAEEKAAAAAREVAAAAAKTALDQQQAKQRANRPFSKAQGDMPFPARGRIVARFGQATEDQGQSKGVTIETRGAAQVVAPYDGQVVFAGPFRGYGLLLIIEHGEGYHTLLSGMERIDGAVGQHLARGEPVGVMGQGENSAHDGANNGGPAAGKPLLYVEFRHNGQAINPLPWLTARKLKVSG